MCHLIFGSFTHHQVVMLKGHLAIVTLPYREKSSGSMYPYIQGAPLSTILEYGLSKHDTLNQWCFTVGPKSVTPAEILTSEVDPEL